MSKQSKRNYQNQNTNRQNQNSQSMNYADEVYTQGAMNDLYDSYSQSSVKRSKNSQRRSGAQNKNVNDCR